MESWPTFADAAPRQRGERLRVRDGMGPRQSPAASPLSELSAPLVQAVLVQVGEREEPLGRMQVREPELLLEPSVVLDPVEVRLEGHQHVVVAEEHLPCPLEIVVTAQGSGSCH